MSYTNLISDAGGYRGVIVQSVDESALPAMNRRRSKLVLCVDDDPNIRQIVKHCLADAGYPVLVCRDGDLCLSMLSLYEPRMILLDVEMPELDGYQTLKEIRARFPRLRAKVMFLTGRRTVADVQMARELEIDGYMIKPFTRANLIRRLDRLSGI
ncbi:MAG: response regulator [Rhodospirillaceae bacterium]|nr:response regulator [Rhodospirillaceae bacterium]